MRATPSQTAGPFFSIGLRWAYTPNRAGGLHLAGVVLDGERKPVVDAVLEFWQTGAPGGLGGFGRVATNADGHYRFSTHPPERAGAHAPHLQVSVFARGLLRRLVSRVYLPGDLDGDPVLALVPPHRRDTLVARATPQGLSWDIVLQGDGETVFFEI